VVEHGTASRYALGCRCTDCRTAKNRYDKGRHLQAQALGAAYPHRIPHGTSNGYQHWGCRCDPCREARREAKKRWQSAAPKTRPAAAEQH